jgi:hypothetical protein
VRPSWIETDKAPATGEFVERPLFGLEPARLEGFEPTTPGSENWRVLSQEVILRTKWYFMLSWQNAIVFVESYRVPTNAIHSVSRLLAETLSYLSKSESSTAGSTVRKTEPSN